jgi:hypothetical protein
MILPTKGVGPDRALLSIGAGILRNLEVPKTVSNLWADMRRQNEKSLQISFDWFVLALDLLYLMGAVDNVSGQVHRLTPLEEE